MNIPDNNEGLDDHDQLAACMQADIQPPIGQTLHSLLSNWSGHVVFEGSPSRKVFNSIGSDPQND